MDSSHLTIGIIDFLKSKPFVHIISEPRTGSSALYGSLSGSLQLFNLNEPFDPNNKPHVRDHVLTYLNNNASQCRVMKNHAFAILDLNHNEKERLWKVPAFNVGLSRRDWFAQTCSLALAEYTQNWDFPHSAKFNVPVDFFEDKFRQLMGCKNDLSQLDEHYDILVYYEDIKFPKSQSHRHISSQTAIENIEQLREVYSKLKSVHQKYWRLQD
jgi:hypothetical protein